MKMTGLSHLFKCENFHNWWLTKYFFAPLYICFNNEIQNTEFKNTLEVKDVFPQLDCMFSWLAGCWAHDQ